MWCRFPYDEEPNFPAPDDHPALVRQVARDQDGNPWVTVVYGTSQPLGHGIDRYEIPPAELASLGLNRTTTLCLWRERTIPYASEFFALLPGRTTPTRRAMSEALKRDFQIHAGYYQHAKAERG